MFEKMKSYIEKADILEPNHFSMAEKVAWLNELEGAIRAETKKIYSTAQMTAQEDTAVVELPPGIFYEDVRYVYVNGRPAPKAQMTGFESYLNAGLKKGDILKIVYLTRHAPIRYIHQTLQVQSSGKKLTGDFSALPIIPGDYLEVTNCLQDGVYQVEMVDEANIVFYDAAFSEGTHTKANLRRLLTDPPEVAPPYDKMYVEYLLSKISYFGRDYEGYQNIAAQFNSTMEAYKNYYNIHRSRVPEARIKYDW